MAAGARRHLAAGLTLVLTVLGCAGAVTRGHAQQAPIIIKELAVEGNRRVQEAVILGRVRSTLGSPFNPAQLSDDIRAIFALGFFDDVQAKVTDFEGGVRLTFVVKERPFVRDIAFTGNKVFSTATLQEKVDVKLGSVYNPVEVQRSVDALKTYYEEDGYLEAKITPEVERFGDGDVKIVFAIAEGRRITINRIVIVGNKGLTAKQIREAMTTQEREFFILRGKIQRQKLDEDVERILNLYNDHGYIQARVETTDVAVDRERADATVTITVVEGPQFRVGEIKTTGITLLPPTEVERQYTLKSGDVFSRTRLRETVQGITDLYSIIGRASVEVLPRTENIPSPPTVNITYEITEGPEVYVERINIAGNTRSEDKILRREIPMAEGDLFTLKKLNTARQRLVNLGYFETVNATTQPGSDPAKIIVNFEVTEKPSGIFSIGGGYSSADSLVGTIDLAQNNFLGRGYQAAIRIRAGELVQQGVISFTDPWLFDMPLAGGFDLFSLQREYTEYTYASLGGTLRLSKPFEEFWRATGAYRLSRDTISNINSVATQELQDQEGTTDHLHDPGRRGPGQPRQRVHPEQGRAVLGEWGLRRARRRQPVRQAGGEHLPLPAHLVQPHRRSALRGRLPRGLGRPAVAALRALLPRGAELAARLEVPPDLPGRFEWTADRWHQSDPRQRGVPDPASLQPQARAVRGRRQRLRLREP